MRSVALIDDDADVRESLAALLGSFGLANQCFTSAEDFLAMRHSSFACVVSDYTMPGLSGLQLLRLLRFQGETVPFIIVTAFSHPDLGTSAAAFNAPVIRIPEEISCIVAYVRNIMEA